MRPGPALPSLSIAGHTGLTWKNGGKLLSLERNDRL